MCNTIHFEGKTNYITTFIYFLCNNHYFPIVLTNQQTEPADKTYTYNTSLPFRDVEFGLELNLIVGYNDADFLRFFPSSSRLISFTLFYDFSLEGQLLM